MIKQFESLVGKKCTEAQQTEPNIVSVDQVKQISSKFGFNRVRVMKPGTFGDFEYDINRVTLYLDDNEVIERVVQG